MKSENDKKCVELKSENITHEEMTARLLKQLEKSMLDYKPAIIMLEKNCYTMGKYKDPEELLKFAAAAIKNISEMVEEATGLLTQEELLETILVAVKEIKEDKKCQK